MASEIQSSVCEARRSVAGWRGTRVGGVSDIRNARGLRQRGFYSTSEHAMSRALELANQTTPWTGPQLSEIDGLLRDYATVEAELLRLCGPVCEDDGKRAIEHTAEEFRSKREPGCRWHHQFRLPDPDDRYYKQDGSCVYTMINGMPCRRFPNDHMHDVPCSYPPPHPPSPAIEVWLRERAK